MLRSRFRYLCVLLNSSDYYSQPFLHMPSDIRVRSNPISTFHEYALRSVVILACKSSSFLFSSTSSSLFIAMFSLGGSPTATVTNLRLTLSVSCLPYVGY